MTTSSQLIPINQESKLEWNGLNSKNVHLAQRKHLTMKGEFKLTLGSEPMVLKGKVHFPQRLGVPMEYRSSLRIFNHRYESQIDFTKTEFTKGFGFIPSQKKYNATKFLSYLNQRGQKTKLQLLYDEVKMKRTMTGSTPPAKLTKDSKLPFLTNEKASSLSVKQLNQNKLSNKEKQKMELIMEDKQSVEILDDWTKKRKNYISNQ